VTAIVRPGRNAPPGREPGRYRARPGRPGATNALRAGAAETGSEMGNIMKNRLIGRVVIPLTGALQSAAAQPPPHNPRTLAQQTHRSYLASASARWRELTDPQRLAWRMLGSQLRGRLTGHQAYVKINTTLAQCGLAQVELPPDLRAFGILNCAGLLADDTPQIKLLQVHAEAIPGDGLGSADRLIIEATPPLSAGIRNAEGDYRQVAVVPGLTATPVDLDLTAAYLARFHLPQLGQRLFVRLTEVSRGFKGVTLQCDALVAHHAG
jgi:hypothetical protein